MSIELTGVKKSYGKKEVLHGIDLSFGQGVYGLLGPNGAGKTTASLNWLTIPFLLESSLLIRW